MKLRRATFAAALPLALLFSLQANAQCSNASLNGNYFSSFGGTVLVGTTNQSHEDLGKLMADGNGNLSGSVTASVAGTFTTLPATGSYTIKANCSGSGTLAANGITLAFTLQIIDGGNQALASVTSSDLGQLGIGRLYRAGNTTGANCGTGSLSGTYGLVLSGGTYAAAIRSGYDAVGQATFDGNGNVMVTGQVTSGTSLGINWNGTGVYSVNSDCTGTLQVTSPNGTVNYSLARIQGGGVELLETDTGTTISGSLTAEDVGQVVPQIAFGGGWYTALYFSNTTSLSQTFVVTFTADDGTPMTVPGAGTSKRITLAANSTAIIEAQNEGALTEGYATFSLPAGVTGYCVLRQSIANIADQEVTVSFRNAAATATTFTFDDTNYITALALVNTSTVATTATITAYSANGTVVGTGTIAIGAGKKVANTLRGFSGLSGVNGDRGTAVVTVPNGNVELLGLRFTGSAFTAIPTTQQQ
ncbi:MAG TPA: hypothetical protein VGL53_00315 [Bryobacteraceae bacterium]|jgi:hypothetical protein